MSMGVHGINFYDFMILCNNCAMFFSELIIDREARELMYLVASVRPSVRPLTAEPFDLRP